MRTIPSAVQTEIATGTAVTRTLIKLVLDSGSYYFTNHDANISFGGQTYVTYRLSHGSIRTFLENKVDNLSFEIDNVDQAQSAIFAATDFQGRAAEVYKVFLNKTTLAIIDGFLQFKGVLDQPKISEATAQHKIVNIFDRSATYFPWRMITTTCPWTFKRTECAYAGAGTTCDETYGTCKTYNNQVNFGGFFDRLLSQTWGLSLFGPESETSQRAAGDKYLPLAYGTIKVPGYPVVGGATATGANLYAQSIYAFCSGEIDSIQSIFSNGRLIYPSPPTNWTVTPCTGTSSQTIVIPAPFGGSLLPDSTYYFRRTAAAFFNVVDIPDSGAFAKDFTNEIAAIVKGQKVRTYNTSGVQQTFAYSANTVWCLLDFLMYQSKKPLASADIDWTFAVAAATACTTLGYEVSLAITDQTDEQSIIAMFLNACRGYITYASGKMRINVEQTGSSVHTFNDTPGGADNICEGSFEYWREAVNDVPNRIIVEYTDAEIRENMALVTSSTVWGAATVTVADLRGTFGAAGSKTFYVAGVSCTGTWNGTTQFTSCSWGTRPPGVQSTLPAGYPLFVGNQTFPQMTAIYNDDSNQAAVKRVIEKKIDGQAIPSYRQAYWIAEYTGKKSVTGNLYCKFRGMMDSLHVEAGDIVTVTHTLPGWSGVLFRVTQAEESEDEEITFTCQYYDPAYYTQGASLGAGPGTTLPNPYAAPDHVTGLAVAQEGFVYGSSGESIPAINITYTPPDTLFFGWANIDIDINGAGYINYGVDYSFGTGYMIDAVSGGFKTGDIVTVRVTASNQNGVLADAATAPTQATTITTPGIISIGAYITAIPGSVLTQAATPGVATLFVGNTSQFPTTGSAWIWDKNNPLRWAYFEYGSKSSTSLFFVQSITQNWAVGDFVAPNCDIAVIRTACSAGATQLTTDPDVGSYLDLPNAGSGIVFSPDGTSQDAFSWTGQSGSNLTGCTGLLAHSAGDVVMFNTLAQITLDDASLFPSSGAAWIIDNGYDLHRVIYWTGKNGNTLTGVVNWRSLVTPAALLVPVKATQYISANGDIRQFADRGDGIFAEIASIKPQQSGSSIAVAKFGNNKSSFVGAKLSSSESPLIIEPSIAGVPANSAEPGAILLSSTNRMPFINVPASTSANWKTFFGACMFESAVQTIYAGSLLTLAHGLGKEPILTKTILQCITDDGGYTGGTYPAGDRVPVPENYYFYNATGYMVGAAITADSTNVYVRFGNAYWSIPRKDTGAPFGIDVAKWKLIVRAWA